MMQRMVPSQAVQVIDQLFPDIAKGSRESEYTSDWMTKLKGVVAVASAIPESLLIMPRDAFGDFIVSIASIEAQVEHWHHRGEVGQLRRVHGTDPVALIRDGLAKCPDEIPSPHTAELTFVQPEELRSSIREDISAANHALETGGWKAATVLAGAAIEALLLQRLNEVSQAQVAASVRKLTSAGTSIRHPNELDRWDLHAFIEVAHDLSLIKPETPETRSAALLAKDFRNLIHPGRVARLGQQCNRATALSAVGALEHVVRDLS